MKKIIIAIVVVVAIAGILASCNGGLKGNGNVITQSRKVSTFDDVEVEGIFPVTITQDGGPAWVKVTADENLQHLIKVVNSKGNKLKITFDEEMKLKKNSNMKVVINITDLRKLKYEAVGDLSTNMLKVDSLQIDAEAVGKLNLNITANFLRANLQSIGGTTIAGEVKEARINNESVGFLGAYGLKAQTIMIHNTGIGNVKIYADSAFYIRNESVGNLTYKGPGAIKELSSTGVGKVQKAD